MLYQLHKEQILKDDPAVLWDFISRPENLERITPPDMQFQIISNLPEKMHNGLVIEYRIKLPFMGRQSWVSEIREIEEGVSFIDEQRFGPYKFWHHRHVLEKVPEGVKMTDTVNYALPFGIFGRMAHFFYVSRKLNSIFEYRTKYFEQNDIREVNK